jgi:hypothetical protein
MHRQFCTIAAPFAVSLLFARPLNAQGYSAAAAGPSMAAARVGVSRALETASSPVASTARGLEWSDTRSSGLALGMSAVIPGTGSLYAGNTRHGIVHMAVATATVLTIAGAAGSCVLEAASYQSSCDTNDTVVNVAAAGFVANYVWSILSAVHDAKAYNRRGHAAH